MDVGRSWFDAERQIDDAVALSADVQMIKSNTVTSDDKSSFQETVDCAVPEKLLKIQRCLSIGTKLLQISSAYEEAKITWQP